MKNATSKKSRRLGRGAKIAGVIVALTLAVVTILAIALPSAATFNETAYNKMPTWLPGGGVIGSATPILNFDGANAKSYAASADATYTDQGEVEWPASSGNNVYYVTYPSNKVSGQDTITFTNSFKWDGGYDGLLYYFDLTQATGNVNISLCLQIGGNNVRPIGDNYIDAYYCLDYYKPDSGNAVCGNWISISGHTGARLTIPRTTATINKTTVNVTKGWLYIPLDSYYTSNGDVSKTHISALDGKDFTSLQFYAGGDGLKGKTAYFDSVYAIKRNEAEGLPTTAPNGALGNLTNFGFDIAEGFSDYTEIDSIGNGNYATNTRANGVLKLQYNYNSEVSDNTQLKCERGELTISYKKNGNNINAGESVLKFDKGTDGVMFYVDASNVAANNGKFNGKIAFELCLEGGRYGNDYREFSVGWMRSSGGKGYAYDVNSKQWIEANAVDAGRMAVPVGFEGYIYIPFNQYKDDAGNVLSDIVENYNVYFPGFRLFTAGVNVEESVEPYVIFDNIGGVKFQGALEKSAAPTILPNGQGIAANPVTVLDFESTVYSDASGTAITKVQKPMDAAISTYGDGNKAFVLSNMRNTRPQQNLYRASGDTVSVSGATGLMYYLNLTDLEGGQSAYYNEYTSIADGRSETSFLAVGLRVYSEAGECQCDNNVAYYYTDGQWYKTNAVSGNRILFPEGFEGYVYLPLTSYSNGLASATQVKGVFLLTTGIIKNNAINAVNQIILDDVQFVTATGVAASNANSIPAMPQYIVGGATGLSEFTTTDFINFEGNQSIYNANASFTADFQSWKGLDMILKTDAAKNDTELVLDMSTNAGQGRISFKELSPWPVIKADNAMNGSGIVFHLDISGMESACDKAANVTYTYDGVGYSVKNGIGLGLNLIVNNGSSNVTYSTGSWAADRSIGYGVDHVPVFYSADGAEYWQVTTNTNNSRVIFPENFSGWVYIPWTSLTRNTNAPDADIVSDNTSVESLTLRDILFYTSSNVPVKTEAAQFVIDDFSTVTLTTPRDINVGEFDEEIATYIAAGTVMRPGANIRVGANGTGIRFFTDVEKTGYYSEIFQTDYLTDYENAAIRFGTLIVPADFEEGNLTRSNAEVLDIPVKRVYSEDENTMTYTAVIKNIPFAWYNENLSAVSYVVYGDGYNPDGTVNGTYIYSNKVTQSYAGVAKALGDASLAALANTPSTMPPSGNITAYKQIIDFDNNFEDATPNATRGSWKIVDTVMGKSFQMYEDNTTVNTGGSPEVSAVKTLKGVDVTGYTGFMFYVDTTGIEPDTQNANDYMSISIPLTISNNPTGDAGKKLMMRTYLAKDSNVAYYYLNGSWTPTALRSNGNDRFKLPNDFAGYVYVPLAAYSYGNSTDASKSWATNANSCKYIVQMALFTDDVTGNVGYLTLDNFYLVK